MGRTLIYIVLLAVLGIGVYFFVFKDKDAFSGNTSNFKIEDTASIGKMFLADKAGNTILVERTDKGWILNKQYPALPGSVEVILETLKRQTTSYPVPKSAYDNVIRELAGHGVKVEVYNKSGDKIRVFYVTGQVANANGSYMLMDGADQPYVVVIPGMDGYVASRYSTQMNDWRDRNVFDVPQEKLKQVKVEYPQEPLNNFTFVQEAPGKFKVIIDPSLKTGNPFNERRATVYSKYFANANSEGYINGTPGLDTLVTPATKRVALDVTSTDNKTTHVDIYWMPINRRSKNMLSPAPGVPPKYDADRFYAVVNGSKDTIVVQSITFEKMFRRGMEFYMPDENQELKFDIPKGSGDVIRGTKKK